MSTPAPAAPNGWRRNWKWWVAAAAALLLTLFAAVVFGIVTLVFGVLRNAEPYRHALEHAQSDPAVVAALGRPIRAGWFVQGHLNVSGGSGQADLAIPLDGPRADGTLYVVAEKRAGAWRYETLAVNVDGGPRIVLEGGGTGHAPPR